MDDLTQTQDRLNTLLTEFDQCAAWETLAASGELRTIMATRKTQIAEEVAKLLGAARQAGVKIALTLPAAAEPTAKQKLEAIVAELAAAIDKPNEFDVLIGIFDERERWKDQPPPLVEHLLNYLFARMRHFESKYGRQNGRMNAVCDAVRSFARGRVTQPVNGSAANDRPKKTWAEDAASHLQQLRS